MSYVDKNLMNNESVVYKANIHWFMLLPGLFAIAIGLTVLYGIGKIINEPLFTLFGSLIVLIGIYRLIKDFIVFKTTELAVTTKRVIAKFGFIRRNTIELNHSKVESFSIEQGVVGMIFNFGTLTVNGTGGRNTPIPSISTPLEFRRRAMQVIDDSL